MLEQWAQNEHHFLVSLTVGGIVEYYQLYLNHLRGDISCFHVNQAAAFYAYKQECVIVQIRTISCGGKDPATVVGRWFV